jgi:hypothetical protein
LCTVWVWEWGGVYLDHLDAFCGEGLRVGLAGVARYAANLPLLGEVGVGKDGADHGATLVTRGAEDGNEV